MFYLNVFVKNLFSIKVLCKKFSFFQSIKLWTHIPGLFVQDIYVSFINYNFFRYLWFVLFSFAIYYGYLLYTPFLDTWYNEPTVIATDQADFPVEKLPFPAITICSNNKIVYRQLESVLRTQPWKGLMSFNWNITQETDNGKFNNNLYRFL